MPFAKQLARACIGALALVTLACADVPKVAPTAISTPQTALPEPVPRAPTSAYVEATPNAPLTVHGTFVYSAGDGSLWLQDADNGDPAPLVERATEAIAQLPAFSPDGKAVAYAALLFLPDGNVRGDIRRVEVDSKHAHSVLRAEANDVVYLYPRFAPDGRLLVTRVEQMQTTDERARLEWMSAQGGGTPQPVVENARDGDVSRNGARIAFVRYETESGKSSLWVAKADGADERALVDADTFAAILSPRFSPDGKWLAFGVHGAPRKNLSQARGDDCALGIFVWCAVKTAHAHMAPGALWRVHLEEGRFEQLTDVYDDSPTPAWSHDGTQIAIHDFTGIRLLDLTRREIYPLFLEDGGSGGFDWSAR